MHKQKSIILAACGAGMIATFLPWASVMGISVDGTKGGDGFISIVLFAIALLLTMMGDRSKALGGGLYWGVVVCGAAALALGIFEISDINSKLKGFGQLGIGLYVLAAAAAVVVLAAFLVKDDKPAA
jgi:hypothetical protein